MATTREAAEQARAILAQAQLDSPDSHFPYKRKAVDALVAKDAPLGPEGPKDASVTAQDFMTPRIAAASEAYVAAQADYLADPSPRNRELYDVATEDLLAARKAHRRTRVDINGNPVLNVTATSASADQDHLRGTRFRRPGEE